MTAALDLIPHWRAQAADLRRYGAATNAATLEAAAVELETALRDEAGELLTLARASAESGYSAEHLARAVRAGTLPNAGRRGAPRIRRSELPRKAHPIADGSVGGYDVGADARSLQTRRATHGGAHGKQA